MPTGGKLPQPKSFWYGRLRQWRLNVSVYGKRNHHKESNSNSSTSLENPFASGTGFFITDDGYLISNYHVVKDATKIRLVTGAGIIDAAVVKVDAANDLALLKADGKFSPLPVAASRGVKLGGTVATIGFPGLGFYEEARKPGGREKEFIHGFLVSLFAFSLSSSAPDQPAGAAG